MDLRSGRFAELFQLANDLHDLFHILLVAANNQHAEIVDRLDGHLAFQRPDGIAESGRHDLTPTTLNGWLGLASRLRCRTSLVRGAKPLDFGGQLMSNLANVFRGGGDLNRNFGIKRTIQRAEQFQRGIALGAGADDQ